MAKINTLIIFARTEVFNIHKKAKIKQKHKNTQNSKPSICNRSADLCQIILLTETLSLIMIAMFCPMKVLTMNPLIPTTHIKLYQIMKTP